MLFNWLMDDFGWKTDTIEHLSDKRGNIGIAVGLTLVSIKK
jgi:hypothetical protein